jgi:hypothetical protein
MQTNNNFPKQSSYKTSNFLISFKKFIHIYNKFVFCLLASYFNINTCFLEWIGDWKEEKKDR